MLPIQTILHPTDFSPQSAYAFRLACSLARDYGARLILAHVHLPAAPYFAEGVPIALDPAAEREALREQLGRLHPDDPLIAVDHRLLEGDPAAEIVTLAREVGCDLIVMGTHGRTGIGRLLMGSVAESILRKAPCPVLTVKGSVPEEILQPVPAETVEAR